MYKYECRYIYIYITDSLGSLPKTAAAELRLCLCFPVTVLEVFGPLGSQGSCYNMLCRSLSELISISVAISVSISMCIYICIYANPPPPMNYREVPRYRRRFPRKKVVLACKTNFFLGKKMVLGRKTNIFLGKTNKTKQKSFETLCGQTPKRWFFGFP